MHARPHRRKDQLPLRSLRDLRETGIRTNEIGLIIKTEIGLMEIGLILF